MNMKKLLLAAVAAPLLVFGQANAADNTATAVTGKISNVTDCTLLSAAVTVAESSAVHGSYYCDTSGAASGMLFFGTCHETGSKADRTIDCTAAGTPHTDCVDGNDTVVASGRAAFLGSSDGGVISGLNLDADECTDTNINSRVGAYNSTEEAALAAQ